MVRCLSPCLALLVTQMSTVILLEARLQRIP